ncbi:MAG: hypothetical protein ACXWUG_28785, partial [Polyangiales bacterium]
MHRDQIEERVDHVLVAFARELGERLADERRIGGFEDLRVIDIAMEDLRQELRGPLRAEFLAVFRIAEQIRARELVLQMQRGGAGAELLEDHEIDPVGPEIEDLGERL